MRIAIVLSLCLTTSCATFGEPDWCVKKGLVTITIPTERLPHKGDCKVKEFVKKVLK